MAITTLTLVNPTNSLASPGNISDNMFARVGKVNEIITELNALGALSNAMSVAESLDSTTGTNAPTLDTQVGRWTTSALNTAAQTAVTFTVTNSTVTADSIIAVTIEDYSGTIATHGIPSLYKVTPGSGSFTITVANVHATNAFSGTLTIAFVVHN